MNLFQSQITKQIKRYLKSSGRINKWLNYLTKLTLKNPKDKTILTLVKSKTNLKYIFKLLILINKLIITNTIQIGYCRSILANIKLIGKTSMQLNIINKGLNPYLIYLQRRNQQRSPLITQKSDHQQLINQMYKLINLIILASAFTGVIYTIGRYCMVEYPFAPDFNIILASDIKILYDELKKITKIVNCNSIAKDIESIHQKMYFVFYNCYFVQHMNTLEINWIQTDLHKIPNHQMKNTNFIESQMTNLQEYFEIFDLEQEQKDEDEDEDIGALILNKLMENKDFIESKMTNLQECFEDLDLGQKQKFKDEYRTASKSIYNSAQSNNSTLSKNQGSLLFSKDNKYSSQLSSSKSLLQNQMVKEYQTIQIQTSQFKQ